ncbi:hypothetical protein MKW92_013980 [Papaver armeniacum]|nr:hypothetical protein MKW92_013980 [Papaver armeniacum]
MASSVIATTMRGTIKRFTTHPQMSSIMSKRFLSSSSIDNPITNCSSAKYSIVDYNPDNSSMRKDDLPRTKDNTDGRLDVDMPTKIQTNIVSEAPSRLYTDDEIKRKLDYMPMYNWENKPYFCNGYADEDSDGMYVKMLVPGLGKENIKKVWVEQKLVGVDESPTVKRTLKMTVRVEVFRAGEGFKNYSTPFFVRPENYKFTDVWAEVYHGALRIFIPKLQPAKIEDVIFDVNLE